MLRILVLLFLFACLPVRSATSTTYQVNDQSLHVATWGSKSSDLPWLVLLSGPIDSWNSDTAWFAALAPEVASHFRVIAIDRAGLVAANPEAVVGYEQFAQDLVVLFEKLEITDATVVAFASSNISLQILLDRQDNPALVERAVLIDPDVLTPFSIARYKGDTQPFKDNLTAYLDYIAQGKYTERVKQKNAADRELFSQLLGPQQQYDSDYFDAMLNARLEIVNQQNLFKEIARYGDDLDTAAALTWPDDVPVTVIDTDFEQAYIDNTQEQEVIEGLQKWREDGATYYQMLVNQHPDSRYIQSDSQAHLYQVAYAEELAELLIEAQQVAK